MYTFILVYLIVPFVVSFFVIKFIRKYGRGAAPPQSKALLARDPMEPKSFRVVRVERGAAAQEARWTKVGDYETQDETVSIAYRGRSGESSNTGVSYLVLNDTGEVLQEV